MMPTMTNDPDVARSISGTRVFDAPRELVFDAWTDARHISNWWGPRGFTTTTQEMDVRPGGQWTFVMHGPDGTDYPNEVVYLDVVRPERIVYTHGPSPIFDVTVTFEELGPNKTRMTMRSTFASAEIRDQVAEDFGAVEGLRHTLERLEEELAKRGAFVISRAFAAPRDVVFRVWTECEHLERWWGPKGVTVFSCRNDPRPDGTMHYGMRTPEGEEIWGRWVYREIAAPERLVFVNSFSDPKGGLTRHPGAAEWPLQLLTTITFDERDGGTLVTVHWSPYDASDLERATFDAGFDSMRGGWGGTLDQLGGYLAKKVKE
jgi:uncharacterized protein YndB with AHSA1/START domain